MSPQRRREIERARPARQIVDPQRAQACWIEDEADGQGNVVPVATILLTVSECPWRCAMCDLWKNTLTQPTPRGAVPRQIAAALAALPRPARWLKLYNAGSFFDAKSIPPGDVAEIARMCQPFQRVIVENHPRLCNERAYDFQQSLSAQLEIALGIETLQTGMLRRLQKGMNRDCIDRAIDFLSRGQIDTRAFVLIRPPWTQDDEAVRWTQLTLRHLFRRGVRHASLIPVRGGNGWLDHLAVAGEFTPPTPRAVERAADLAIRMQPRGVVTVDLWDWPPQESCPHCAEVRRERLTRLNLTQRPVPTVNCAACAKGT